MLGAIKSYTSNLKALSSKEVQKLPLSERLKLAGQASSSLFRGEDVHISTGALKSPPPMEKEEVFIETPPPVLKNEIKYKQHDIPLSYDNRVTGEKYELKKTDKGAGLAVFEDSSKTSEADVKPELKQGNNLRVIDGDVYVNGRIMDPETGRPGDKGYWTFGDKVVTGKKADIIGDEIYVDGKQWDPSTGKFTGTCYWNSENGTKVFGKEAYYEGPHVVVDGVPHDIKTGEKIDYFQNGVEAAADGVNMAIGGIGGSILGAAATLGTAAALAGGTIVLGPLGFVALLALGGVGGAYIGGEAGKEASNVAGKIGGWISKKMGGREQTGRTIGKAALSLGVTAPVSIPLGLVAEGSMLISGAAMEHAAEKRK